MPKHGQLLELDRCPHCSVDRPHLVRNSLIETSDHTKTFSRHWGIYVCTRCGGVITAWSRKNSVEIEEMYPEPMEVHETIPGKANQYLEQAINSISAPAGAVMLAASSVDAMLKEKGLIDGSLYIRINQAAEQHLITNEMAQWAHDVRLDANDQRHADEETDLPTPEDAKKVIDFTQALGTFLYVLPSRVQRGIENAQNS